MRPQTLESAQQRTIASMTDAFFPQLAEVQQARRNPAALTCKLLNQAKALKVNLELLVEQYADSDGNLAESIVFMDGVCMNLAAHLRDIEQGAGKLIYSITERNGHIHACCDAGNCVSWME